MKCMLCNYENSEDARFCMGCGSTIPRCPTCGKVLTNRDRFCSNDGTPLSDDLLALVPDTVDVVADSGFDSVDVEQTIAATVQDTMAEAAAPIPKKAFCLNCGTPVWEGETYCPDCRSKLEAPTAVVWKQSVCASCGMACPAGEDYCDYCRPADPVPVVNMDYAPPRTVRTVPPKKKKRGGGIGVAILLILLLIIVGVAAVYLAAESGLIELPEFLSFGIADEDYDSGSRDDDSDEDTNGDSDGNSDSGDTDDSGQTPGEGTTAPSGDGPVDEPTSEATEPPTTEATEPPTTEATEPVTDKEKALQYFINNCDKMYFDEDDIKGFDKEMCRYARNACYAKSGRKFKDKELQAYYEKFDWYEPTYEPSSFKDEMMNAYQRKNISLITTYEKEMGYR